jgi:AbrB family looped-hinge helix DNA binding protein
MSIVTKISDKGQLVIPKEIRKRVDLKKGDSVTISEEDGVIMIKKTKTLFDMIKTVKVSKNFDKKKSIEDNAEEKNEE